MFSLWFDLLLPLLCTNHIRHRDWHKGDSIEHGCGCAAAAVLLLYCFIRTGVLMLWLRGSGATFEKKHRSSKLFCVPIMTYGGHTADTHMQKQTHIHAEAPSVAVTKGCCCAAREGEKLD